MDDQQIHDRLTTFLEANDLHNAQVAMTAEKIAQSIIDSYEKAEALSDLAIALSAAGRIDQAVQVLVSAERQVQAAEGNWQKAESLGRIARAMMAVGQKEQAIRIWDNAALIAQNGEVSGNIQDSIDCSSVLWEISEDLALAGEWERAERIAWSIRNRGKRERAGSGLKTIALGRPGSWPNRSS